MESQEMMLQYDLNNVFAVYGRVSGLTSSVGHLF
jgi:hypothetical protein